MKDVNRPPQAGALRNRDDDLLEMLGSIAHKLSQPVTSLQGTIEVALMGEMDVKEYRRSLEISLQETQRVAEILEALRDIVEMERSGIEVQPISWTEIIESALDEASSSYKENGPRLISDVKGDVWVIASPQKLSLATIRLISGTLKATREGHAVRIVLSVTGGKAFLTVCREIALVGDDRGNGPEAPGASAKPALGEIEEWILNRAIECQGGRLSVRQNSQTSECYQMNLPLASPGVPGNGRP